MGVRVNKERECDHSGRAKVVKMSRKCKKCKYYARVKFKCKGCGHTWYREVPCVCTS